MKKISMERTYFRVNGEYWEWEKSGQIFVFGIEVPDENILITLEDVNGVIKCFNLPINVNNGNANKKEDFNCLKEIFHNNIIDKRDINFDSMENELIKIRKNNGVLEYGIVVIFNGTKYKFFNPEGTHEPAIWGKASADGLVLVNNKFLHATRHEIGHMIGLGRHHEGCIMSYASPTREFCENCRKEIGENWDFE